MSQHAPSKLVLTGAGLRVGVAAARYNEVLVDALLAQVLAQLRAAGVKPGRLDVIRVPGANELPAAIQLLCARRRPDVCLALGVVIRGETRHYELVAAAASQGLMRVGLDARTPVINGVIVAENERQAVARCHGRRNRGAEFARAALEMGALKRRAAR